MPVIAIALNCQSIGRESIVNCIWRNGILRDRCQTGIYQSIKQGCFYATNSLLRLLRKSSGATSGTGSKTANQRGFYIADFAANFALHFYLFFVEWMRLANLCFCSPKISAPARAAVGVLIWECNKFFAAFWTYLFYSWLTSWRIFICFIRADARAIFTRRFLALTFKTFTADYTNRDRIFLFGIRSVTTMEAFLRAILLFFESWIIVDTTSRANVHGCNCNTIALQSQYEQQTTDKPTPNARGETLTIRTGKETGRNPGRYCGDCYS